MTVDGEVVGGTSRLVDDTETVTLSFDNVDDREGNLGTTIESSDTVDGTGIRDGNDVVGCVDITSV